MTAETVTVDAQELHTLIEAYKGKSPTRWYNGLGAMVPIVLAIIGFGTYLIDTGLTVEWIVEDQIPDIEAEIKALDADLVRQIQGVKSDLTARMDREHSDVIIRLERMESLLLEIASRNGPGTGFKEPTFRNSSIPIDQYSNYRWPVNAGLADAVAFGRSVGGASVVGARGREQRAPDDGENGCAGRQDIGHQAGDQANDCLSPGLREPTGTAG